MIGPPDRTTAGERGRLALTIKDIARESGYAVGTVSRVLNDHPDVSPAAREQIMAVVKRHNFRPNSNAKRLKQQGASGIAIVVKGVGNLLFARVLEEIQRSLKTAGKTTAVYYLDEDDNEVEQAVRVCREQKPLGIVFLGGNRENFIRRFEQVKCPSVLVSTRADAMGFDQLSSVSTDDVQAATRAIDYLLDRGHRCIGVIGGQSCVPGPEMGCNTSQLRLMGCVDACARRGVPFDPATQTVQQRYSMEGGYKGAWELMDRLPGLTAIFAMSDVMAVGAMRAIRDRGLRVPEDISLIGFDGIELANYCTPKLTTIRQDGDRMARRGVEILLGCVEGTGPTIHEIIPFQLSPGESVRAIEQHDQPTTKDVAKL